METNIVLPKNTGLKDAYIAILKMSYLEQRDTFLFHDFVFCVQSDCGLANEMAMNRCKQLNSLSLLKYIDSGLAGHNYKLCVYIKNGSGEISYVHNLPEAGRLIEAQFADIVETEFVQIRKMNIQDKPSEMRFDRTKTELEFRSLELAKPIKTESDETLKTVIVIEGQTTKDVCKAFEDQLKKGSDLDTSVLRDELV